MERMTRKKVSVDVLQEEDKLVCYKRIWHGAEKGKFRKWVLGQRMDASGFTPYWEYEGITDKIPKELKVRQRKPSGPCGEVQLKPASNDQGVNEHTHVVTPETYTYKYIELA